MQSTLKREFKQAITSNLQPKHRKLGIVSSLCKIIWTGKRKAVRESFVEFSESTVDTIISFIVCFKNATVIRTLGEYEELTYATHIFISKNPRFSWKKATSFFDNAEIIIGPLDYFVPLGLSKSRKRIGL